MTTLTDRARYLASWTCTAYCPELLGLPWTPSSSVQVLSLFAKTQGASHALVVRASSTLRHYPIDNLVRVRDVAGLAVHAVGEVDLQLHCAAGFFRHLVHRRRTKILAR